MTLSLATSGYWRSFRRHPRFLFLESRDVSEFRRISPTLRFDLSSKLVLYVAFDLSRKCFVELFIGYRAVELEQHIVLENLASNSKCYRNHTDGLNAVIWIVYIIWNCLANLFNNNCTEESNNTRLCVSARKNVRQLPSK